MLNFSIEITGPDPESLAIALYELFQGKHDLTGKSGKFSTHGPQGQHVECEWKIRETRGYEEDRS